MKSKTTYVRIAALLLGIFLIMTGLPSVAAAEETAAESIKIIDPGFEEADEGWLKHWIHKETEGAEFAVSTSKKHTGNSSLHISAVTDTYSWVKQGQIYGLNPGSMYAISVFINADITNGDGAATFVEYYTETGEYINKIAGMSGDSFPNGEYIGSTNDRWVEHICIFRVPEGAAVGKVYTVIRGTGDAWFDDISITFSGGPEPYRFDTTRVFNYKETKESGAYVVLDPYYENSDTEKDTRIDFELLDGETVLAKEENVKFDNLKASFTYRTEGMTPYKPYAVNCRIKDKNGNVLESHTRNVYVVDRPTILDTDGDFVIDGKKVNPVIGWDVAPSDYEKAKEAGINTVIVPTSTNPSSTINALQEAGLYILVAIYRHPLTAGHPDVIEETKQIIEAWRDVPNVLGYAMHDEPFLSGDNPELRGYIETAYLVARELDPVHSVFLVDKRYDYITAQYCDTYILDAYAYGESSVSISKDARAAWAATKDINGFWELAATYGWTAPMPPMNTVRGSIYRAFEEGARAMGYYTFGQAMTGRVGYENREKLYYWEEWEPFCTFNNEEVPILFDYFVNGNAVRFNTFDDGNGDRSLKWFTWFVDDDMYLVAHNRNSVQGSVKIPLQSANGKISVGGFKAEPIGLTTQAEIKGKNSIALTLGAEEIALYKIIPDQTVDLSKVNEPAENQKEEVTEDGIFSDLAGYDWAKDAIESLYEDGIVTAKEEGIYAPGEAITRLDFVSALVRALGLTEEGEGFADCDTSEIKIARGAGITNGDTDGNFRPYDTITRQDIMTTAVRALNAGLSEAEIPEFSDSNLVSDYAKEAVQVMTQAGVIKGNGDGTLNPLGNATRAEAAVMLERMLGTEFTEKPDPSEIREEIEFTTKIDETTLQKWSDAADLIKGLGIAEPALETSVTKGDFEVAVSNLLGTNYDAFAENNKAITYEEAVEALVKLLGYEAYAASRGGYMAMAAQLDLTKGLAPETYMRGGELCVLLENAIEIKMAERTGYGETESYRETEDTLLSAYRNIYKYKGTVNGDYYTNTELKKGEILLDGEVFTGGEGFFKQRVVAYAEHTKDEKKIVYIKAANDTEVITVDCDEILEADASKIRVDGNGGKDKIYSISGADVYVNGEKKTSPTGADLRPDMGTVSLISVNGTISSVLVEKYENRIVKSVFAEDNTVYFKNGKELVIDAEKGRFYMDFSVSDLKEWDVLSVMLRADGTSLYKVIASSENVQGAPSETSADGILLGETIYPVAKTVFGTPALGTEAIFYLDFNGTVAAVNDEGASREYGYFTSMEGGKGLTGGLNIRIFTKKGKMIVFPAAENIKLNGNPITHEKLLADTRFMSGTTPKGQLIVYELNEKEEITEITTAIDASNCTNLAAPKEFSKVFTTTGWGGMFDGYALGTFGTRYRVDGGTVSFYVPPTYSADPNDYRVSMGKSSYVADNVFLGGEIYDWDTDFTVGALVWKEEVKTTVDPYGTQGIFLGLGEALDNDGLPAKAIRILDNDGKERTYYAAGDMKVIMDAATFTDLQDPDETEKTGSAPYFIMNSEMPFEALNVGDVVQYSLNRNTIGAIRVQFRAKSPKIGEYKDGSGGVFTENELKGQLALAFGSVQRVFDDGFSMTPSKGERLFLHHQSSGGICPVIIMDMKTGKYKVSDMSAMREGDMVFAARINTYQSIIAIYR